MSALHLLALACLVLLAMPGCRSTAPGHPVFRPDPVWGGSGTLVVFMPDELAAAKERNRDPLYRQWRDNLLAYVGRSKLVADIAPEPRRLTSNVRISSKTIPSSDYSVLIIGERERGVHISDPLVSADDYDIAENWLLGGREPKTWPQGVEALRLARPDPVDFDGALFPPEQ